MPEQPGVPGAGASGSENTIGPDEFARLAELHRGLEPADREFEPPPPVVWDRIELALDGAPDGGRSDAVERLAAVGGSPAPSRSPGDGTRRRAEGPGRWRRRLLAAAAAAVVAGVVATGALALLRDDGPTRTELASAALTNAGLDPRGEGATGTARLVRRNDRTYLDVQLADPPAPTDGYLEVWLIAPDLQGMVSLGPFRGDGLYLVPAGVDPARFPTVDVSEEPPDGQPTHSGISLLRGDLA